MLQKLRENSTGWIAKVILVLLAVPFAFFGMEQYMTQRIDTWAAKIEAPPTWWREAPSWWPVSMLWQEDLIEVGEFRDRFEQARQQQRQAAGEAFDAKAFEAVENKRLVLDQLIEERVLRMAAARSGVVIGDGLVRQSIQEIPAFQANGRFDPERYQLALASQVPARSPRAFEDLVRQSLQQSLVVGAVADSAFITDSQADRLLALLGETRDAAYVVLPAPAADAAPVTEAQIADWYKSHRSEYQAPETVALEYIELDASTMPAPSAPDEAALRQRYKEQQAGLADAEQRLASHILVEEGTDPEAARAEALRVAGQARQPGADFAALAREHSDDTGSSAGGGDLGWIAKGAMGDAFDNALFALQPGQVSDPVKTDFGWHVILLREVKASEAAPFEEVREKLLAEQIAADRERAYNELAGQVVDEVYKNPNALGPAAAAAGVQVRTTAPFARGGGEGIAAHPAVQRAAFSEVLIEDGTVSDPIEIGPEHSVLIRVASHTPAQARPLAQVRGQVVAAIRAERAAKAAAAAGQAMAAQISKGADISELAKARGLEASEVTQLPRGAPAPDAQTAEAIFSAPRPAEGKVSAGHVVLPDNRVAVFAVRKVTPGDVAKAQPQERLMLRQQLAQMAGMEDAQAFAAALRERMKITVAEDRL